ncbi:Mitochondrial Carrier (MC) Family [Achlya hypogyna]|uniref:Mitochondrial Carrier (MC) Family n=1 Tax=Achlya hypogyna TaxID=1202772 RepID=A0A1V9Z3Q3_ACHHY|nr:Mitochondrial Carrier (MC) Family [Achlya hypogyna]
MAKDEEPLSEAELAALLAKLDLDTGDVVLFDRKCHLMNAYGMILCEGAKIFGQTRWDHNGVIYKTDDGELLFMEAALSGVKLRPLIDRIRHSRSYEVRIQKLEVQRTPEFRKRAAEFIDSILDVPYEKRVHVIFNAQTLVPARIEREKLYHEMVECRRQIEQLEEDLARRSGMTSFELNSLRTALARLREEHSALVETLDRTERSIFENQSSRATPQSVFCSQLVAAFYQHLGLLLPYPAANSYVPKHFSASSDYMKLQNAAWLPQISLREDVAKTVADVTEASTDHSPPPEALEKIVHALQRHSIFHSFSESELRTIATQFRRHRYAKGQAVFYQGNEGDFFHVIESGECDVFVDYATFRHQTPSAPQGPSASGVNLRRNVSRSFHPTSSTREQILVATNGPGNTFGDSALMYHTPRRATVKCQTDVVTYALDQERFTAIVAAHPVAQKSLSERQFLLNALGAHPLFADLNAQAHAAAVRQCFPLHFPKGTTIIQQGDCGDYVYVIEKGSCALTRTKKGCDQTLLDRIVGPGDSFGEAALLYNSRRGATVHALEDCKVWCMDRAALLTISQSGSTALFNVFNKAASVHDAESALLTKQDFFALFDPSVRESQALETAATLLYHDDSDLANFSQFAHFHMCLEVYSAPRCNPLLAQALYRATRKADAKWITAVFGNAATDINYTDCVALAQQWSTRPISVSVAARQVLAELHRDLSVVEHLWKQTSFETAIRAKPNLTTASAPQDGPVPFRTTSSIGYVSAAVVAGIFARSFTAPLERLKLFRQVQLYPASLNVVRSWARMVATAGWGSLFAGNLVHCAKILPSFPLKLAFCDLYRRQFEHLGLRSEVKNVVAGGCAGVTVNSVVYPFDVIRGRLALQQAMQAAPTYTGPLHCLRTMVEKEGVRSLYRGFTISTIGAFPYIGLNYALYEFFRPAMLLGREDGINMDLSHPSLPGQIGCAIVASLGAQLSTFPYDVIRRKLQMQGAWLPGHTFPTYTSTWDCIKATSRETPWRVGGFYRGLVPNCLRLVPAAVVSFVAYEKLRED